MPKFQYRGYEVEFDKSPSQEEIDQTTAYLDNLPIKEEKKDKSFLEDVKDKYLALGYGGLERLSAVGKQFGRVEPEQYSAIKKEADAVGMENPITHGVGKFLGSMGMVVPAIAAAPSAFSAVAGSTLIGAGSEGLARKSELEEDPTVHPTDARWAAWNRAFTSAPFWALPPAFGMGLPARAATGAGLGVASVEADVYRQNQILKDYPNQQLEQFNFKNDAVAAGVGALFGSLVGRPSIRTRTNPKADLSADELAALSKNSKPINKTQQTIEAKSKDAFGPVERIPPTEETGLTPARTEDVLTAQARQNQSTIDAEMGGGPFIRDRARINELKNLPKQQQETAAWNQLKQEQAIDPTLKRMQEDAAWASRNPPPEPSQGGGFPINRGMGKQAGMIDILNPETISRLAKEVYAGNFRNAFKSAGLTTKAEALDFISASRERIAIAHESEKAGQPKARQDYLDMATKQKELMLDKFEQMVTRLPDNTKVPNIRGPKNQQGMWNPFADSNKPSRTVKPDYNTFIKNAITKGYDSATAAKTYEQLYGKPGANVKTLKSLDFLGKVDSPEEAIKIAEGSADMSSPVGAPTVLNQGRTAALRTFNKGYIALVEFAETTKETIGRSIERTLKNGKTGFIEQYYNMLHKNQADLSEVIETIRKNEFNEDFVPSFAKQSQMDLYNAYKNWQTTMYKTINDELLAQGKKPLHKLPNWWPSVWQGDFSFAVRVETETGTKLVMLVKESSKWKAQQAHKHFKDNSDYILGDVEYTPRIKQFEKRLGAGAATEDLIKLLGDDDPITIQAKELWEAANTKIAYDTAQYKQHFKYKVGIKGSLGDKPWLNEKQNLQDSVRAIETMSRSAAEWASNQRLNRFNQEVQANPNIPDNVRRSFQNYSDDIIRRYQAFSFGTKLTDAFIESMSNIPLVNRVVGDKQSMKNAARDFAAWETVRLLGWNTRMAIQQELQPIYSLLPKMTEFATSFGGSKDVISPLIIGHLQGTKIYAASKSKALAKLLTPDEQAMFKYIQDNEVADLVLIERDQFKNATINQIYKMAGYTLKELEAHSRFEAFNIMTNYFKHSGYNLDDAMKMADNVSREIMGNYSDHVRAGLIKNSGFFGEMAGRLQSFKVFQLSQLAHYLILAKKTGNIVPATTMLSLQTMLGGMVGMIGIDFAEAIMDVVRWATGEKDIPTVKETIIKSTNDHLSFGVLSTMSDTGLYGAFQFNTIGDMGWKNFLPIVGAEWDTINSIGMTAKHLGRVVQGQTSERSKKKEMLQGLLPGSSNLLLENTYARDTSGDILQGKTGEVVYRPKDAKETEPSAMNLLWNLPSFDRAKSKTLNYAAVQKEQAIREQLGKIKLDIIKSMFEMQETTDISRNKLLDKTVDSLMEKYAELNPTGIGEIFEAMERLQERKIKGDYIQNLTTADDLEQMLRGIEWDKEKTKPKEEEKK